MSQLLEEIIRARRQQAIDYEEYLRRVAALIQTVNTGKQDDTPEQLDSPGKRACRQQLNRLPVRHEDWRY